MKFYYGKEGFLINQEINRKIKEAGIEPSIFSNDEPIEDIILDISTVSMFSEEKLIVIKNHSEFSTKKPSQEFIDVISSSEVQIIFGFESEKIDKKNALISYLLKNAECKEYKEISFKEIGPTIRKIVESKNAKISNSSIIQLANKLPVDLRIIISEVEKLIMESSDITIEMVNRSVSKYLNNDYFAFSNAIVDSDARGIISAYQNKVSAGDEFTAIISQISTTLSLSLLVNSYKKRGYSNQEIADEKRIHIFRIKKASELLNRTTSKKIKSLIVSLADLDSNIKSGVIDSKHGLENYLLNLVR